MSFPRYPEYKDSGVEWLGEVPADWSVGRFKHHFKERDERSEFGAETLLSVSAYTGVSPRADIVDSGGHLSRAESLEGYKVCYPGDLVMNIMLAWNRGLGFSNHHGIVSPAYCVFKLNGGCERFFDYLVRSDEYTLYFKAFSSGVIDSRLRLYPDTFGALYLGLPSISEQKSIAAFLDRETAKIDALVAEQEKLIALLQEKRQAVISHAVTKGLNPAAPMKDSGIEWLGEVPAHWDVKRLKKISPFITVGVVVNPSTFVADEGFPFIYGGDIREGVIDWANSRRIDEESSEANSKTRLKAGDLLTVRVGAPGVTAVVPAECEGGNCASVMLVRQGPFNSHWLCFAMNTRIVRFQVEVVQYGAAQEQFNISHAVNFWVPTPPRSEQDQIAEFLASETAKFDTLTAEAQRAIGLLQERRSALISAAVTGKIDVRGLVAEKGAA